MEEALELLLKALRRGTNGGIAEPEHELQYPLYPVPRVAVLGLALRGPRGVHCLPQWSPQELEKLRPRALAGWWRDLAEAGRLAAEQPGRVGTRRERVGEEDDIHGRHLRAAPRLSPSRRRRRR